MGQRFGDDPSLEIAQSAVRIFRLLLDGRQQQGLQIGVPPLDVLRDGPVVRLEATRPEDRPDGRQDGGDAERADGERRAPSPEPVRTDQDETQAGRDGPADRQPTGQIQTSSPLDDRL